MYFFIFLLFKIINFYYYFEYFSYYFLIFNFILQFMDYLFIKNYYLNYINVCLLLYDDFHIISHSTILQFLFQIESLFSKILIFIFIKYFFKIKLILFYNK